MSYPIARPNPLTGIMRQASANLTRSAKRTPQARCGPGLLVGRQDKSGVSGPRTPTTGGRAPSPWPVCAARWWSPGGAFPSSWR
jgi:hypothetical protein